MKTVIRHFEKWSGWYWFLTALSAWLVLLAVIVREGWIR